NCAADDFWLACNLTSAGSDYCLGCSQNCVHTAGASGAMAAALAGEISADTRSHGCSAAIELSVAGKTYTTRGLAWWQAKTPLRLNHLKRFRSITLAMAS